MQAQYPISFDGSNVDALIILEHFSAVVAWWHLFFRSKARRLCLPRNLSNVENMCCWTYPSRTGVGLIEKVALSHCKQRCFFPPTILFFSFPKTTGGEPKSSWCKNWFHWVQQYFQEDLVSNQVYALINNIPNSPLYWCSESRIKGFQWEQK